MSPRASASLKIRFRARQGPYVSLTRAMIARRQVRANGPLSCQSAFDHLVQAQPVGQRTSASAASRALICSTR